MKIPGVRRILGWEKWDRVILYVVAEIIILFMIWFAGFSSIHAFLFPDWTGIPEYSSATFGGERQQTIIDWVELLLVPVVVGIVGLIFSRVQKNYEEGIAEKARQVDREIAEEERKTEREIAQEKRRQDTLENYLDRMKELILDRGLGADAKPEVVRFARTLTLNILRELGQERTKQVTQFLQETEMVEIISLELAHLADIDLSDANLARANLSEADLRRATLIKTNLSGSNLSGAILRDTKLTDATLNEANLRDAGMGNANLHGAELIGANLQGAKLVGANLQGANLSHAVLAGTILNDAKYNKETKWPKAFEPKAAGAKLVVDSA
jgi:hypothetical protein